MVVWLPSGYDNGDSSAHNIYESWRDWLEKQGSFGAYYVDFQEFEIVEPQDQETLMEFITRLAQTIQDEGKGHRSLMPAPLFNCSENLEA